MDALVRVAFVVKSVAIVPTVVDAVLKTAWLRTVRNEEDALARVVCPDTVSVPDRVSAVADAVENTV